jgi:hypothetical protein
VISKFKQEVKDKAIENVIAGKKGDHLVKDLKRQLKMERKKRTTTAKIARSLLRKQGKGK